MSDDNRRTEERAPVDFQVDYIHEGDYVLSFSKNISLGGMYLCTPDPPEPGSKLKLIFPVEDYYQAEVMAVVVWINRSPNVGEVGMGVQFLSPLSSLLKENIMKHIKRVEILKEFEGFA
jgi:c-di-GMP-binding flagellar brake protein YcgR